MPAVVGGELAQVPEAPAVGDVGDARLRSGLSQIPTRAIEAQRLELRLGADAEVVVKGEPQHALADADGLADLPHR